MAQSETGSLRVINISIKNYKTNWKDDFKCLADHNGFCVCLADGDPDIKEAFRSVKGEEGIFSRDLWHIPKQFKQVGVRWSDEGLLNLMKLKMAQVYHKPV